MSDRETIARLYRRAGFGFAPGELDELEALGVDTVIDRLVEPDANGIETVPDDLFAGVELPFLDSALGSIRAVNHWLDALAVTPRPFQEWMAWYWHGHLVCSQAKVAFVPSMTAQVNLFRRLGLGSFRELLRESTIDPAMLRYLDGDVSTGATPNENYGREVLELFAIGFGGPYTEDDVKAAAVALTGWQKGFRDTGDPVDTLRSYSSFEPARHDGTPQTLMGTDGVHDLDTTIDAIVDHEACPQFVASRFGRAVLGPEADDALLEDLGTRFADAGLDLRVLARGVLEAVAEGDHAELVIGPMPWLLSAQRATGAVIGPEERYWNLFDIGHLPLWPPNVGGWPGGKAWLTSSQTAQRYNLAVFVANGTPDDSPALEVAAAGDLEALADALGRPEGFRPSTVDALGSLASSASDDGGIGLLTAALASPDMVIA